MKKMLQYQRFYKDRFGDCPRIVNVAGSSEPSIVLIVVLQSGPGKVFSRSFSLTYNSSRVFNRLKKKKKQLTNFWVIRVSEAYEGNSV